jgi:hypothetical protein
MAEAVFAVVAIALVGSLAVPAAMLVLASLGYFEPIHLVVFGRHWYFARKARLVATFSGAGTGGLSLQPTVMSASIPAIIIIGQLQFGVSLNRPLATELASEMTCAYSALIFSSKGHERADNA